MANKDDVMALISALRAETEESSLTPDRVGYVLGLMLSLLDGYADTVSVGVIRQEVDRALREVAALQAENLSQAEELTRLLGILTRLSNVVQVNGRQLDILSGRVSSNTDRIAALEDSRPDPSVGSVTDVKLDGHSVVNNNGVASLRTPGFLDIKGYVTIHHVMIQTLQDALNALNLYCTENEFDIEQLKARPNIIFGQMDGSTFYDLDDNAVTPDDNSLYIDISADKLYRWNGTAFVEVSGVRITDVPFLENPNTSTPDVFGIYKSFADYYAWVGDHQTSHMMTVEELLDYVDENIGKVVLLLDSASSPEYVQVLSVAGGMPSQSSATNLVELSSHSNTPGLSISVVIDRTGTLTGYTVTAERKTGLTTSSYSGQTLASELSISASGVISKTASGVTKTFNLPAESGTLARREETLPNKTYAPLEFSGLGRKYLQKNIVSDKNILTQAMFQDGSGNALANTIFVIQYDYDLNEQSITVPAGCTLLFEGGSIKNGTIVGNGCNIDGDADIQCSITGIKNDVTHLKWFTNESNKNTAFARALACAGNTILDGDNEKITLSQTVTFGADNSCDLRNLVINFTASSNGQDMFLFDSSTQWQGITNNISHCTFTLTNPTAYNNVHCLHLRRWYNTSRSEISDVFVKDFSGYMYICESYLQEMNFVRFKGTNVGGFVSFNREYNTTNAFGTYGAGGSNILSFTQCGIDGGLNTNTTITDVVSVTKLILCSFDSCVFQGTKNSVAQNTYYFTRYNTGYICNVKTAHTWSEFVSFSNSCYIEDDVCVESNAHFAEKYIFVGKHNALVTELTPMTEQYAASGNYFDIQSGAYPTIRLTPNGSYYYANSIIETCANKCNLIIDGANSGVPSAPTSAVYYREGTSLDLLNDIRKISTSYCRRYFIYENGIRILHQYAYDGSGPLYFMANEAARRVFLSNGRRAYFHLIYRVYPLIEVTSENLSQFNGAGITNNNGVLQGGYFNPFVAGQSLTPSDNIWRQVLTQVSPNITNPAKFSYGRWAMDIAVCEIVDGAHPLKQNIMIDPSDATKLINLTSYTNDYGATDYAPSLDSTMYGYEYFDTTIKMPTFWDGSKWVDGQGYTAASHKGTTANRPTLASGDAGFQYFDTTLGLMVVWNGSAWIVLPKYVVVSALPATPDSNTLYLIAES